MISLIAHWGLTTGYKSSSINQWDNKLRLPTNSPSSPTTNGKHPPLYMRPSNRRRRRRHQQSLRLIPNLQRNQSPPRRPNRIQTPNRRPRNRRSRLLHPRHRRHRSNPLLQITTEHPDLDCLVNNAGVQRPLDITKLPATEFLSKANQEIDINIRGPMHLALGLLAHFRTRPRATIINVSSVLGFVPFSVINPVYNATKAWMHF